MAKQKIFYPTEIIVYVCDWLDGKPVFAIAETPDDIPEDVGEGRVAMYTRAATGKFMVQRRIDIDK